MKYMLGLLLSLAATFTHAQSVDWNRVRASCSSEASAYDAARNGPGDTSYQAMRFVETDAGSPPSAAKLRAKIDEQRKILSDPYYANVPIFRLSAIMVVCAANAALTQLQSGSTQAGTPPSSPVTQREPDPPVDSADCVFVNPANSTLYSKCAKRVSLGWCFMPNDRSDYTNIHCESQKFAQEEMEPGGQVSLQKNAVIAWTYCHSPKRLTDLRYVPGRGLEGKCRR